MAEAFPAEALGDMAESTVFDDPYDNTQKFGIGLKTSPFQNAGVMQGCTFVTAKVQAKYAGVCKALGDVLVNDEDVPEEFFVENEKLDKWRYLKGGKSEPRVDKRTGFTYNYSEGSMAFPDSAALPARTILTSEGGVALPGQSISFRLRMGVFGACCPTSSISCRAFRRVGRIQA